MTILSLPRLGVGMPTLLGTGFRCLAIGLLWASALPAAEPDLPAGDQVSAVAAEEPPIDLSGVLGEHPAETEGETIGGPSERYLLLDNDRIMFGQVEKVSGGYAILRNGGRIEIPNPRIRAVGSSKRELYEFKVSQVPAHDVNEHLKIHKWCLSYGLEAEAQAELENMLKLDPENKDVEHRLRNLQAKSNLVNAAVTGQRRPVATRRPSLPPPEKVIDTFIRGHGSDSFLKYNSIERMLISRCSNGGCHGSPRHASTFRLFGESGKKGPLTTARNLQTVLDAIDLKHPEQSVLLYKAITAHGGEQIAALGGINDPDYRELRDWVFSVAENWSIDVEAVGGLQPTLTATGDNPFGADRRGMVSQTDPRYLRPEKPPQLPGSVAMDHSFPVMADDAPPAPPREMPATTIYGRSNRRPAATPEPVPQGEGSGFGSTRAPEAAAAPNGTAMPPAGAEDPFDPAAFNQRPRRGNEEIPAETPAVDEKPVSFDESMPIPTDNKGGVFKAAPLPFSFLKKIRK